MPKLEVGVDEFTLVLHLNKKIDVMDWLNELNKMIGEFIRRSHIEDLYGKLDSATKKLQAGYTNGLTIADKPWHFAICWHEDIPSMGLCIKYSAHAYAVYCRDFEKKYCKKMNVAAFLQMIQSDIYTMRLSRIDLTADYKDYPNPLAPNTPLDPNTLYSQLKSGRYVIKNYQGKQVIRTFTALDINGAYETFYAGTRKGKTNGFLRCYDKKQEQINTNGYRYDEAIKCKSWVRFEAVFKGLYAHQMTEQLQQISTEDELKELIAKHISDKYRFFDVVADDYLQITDDLAGQGLNSQVLALSCPSNRDSTMRQSIQYLEKNSGLFTICYKVETVWGTWGLVRLIHHLAAVYKDIYKPTAGEKPEIKDWHKNHYKELRSQRLEDNFV